MDIKSFFLNKNLNLSSRVELVMGRKTKYLVNASESYGVELCPNKTVLIMDDTVFGSGKDGCVISGLGIAFKKIFERPVCFSFDKIKKISIFNKKIIINEGYYIYEFDIVDQKDINTVFSLLQEWIKIKESYVHYDDMQEYGDKIEFIKRFFKSDIIPILESYLDDCPEDEEKIAEGVCECIDDIKNLEELFEKNQINFKEAIYIDNMIDLLSKIDELFDGDFDEKLLEKNIYDRAFGGFIKSFLKPLVNMIKTEKKRISMRNKINNF